MGKLQEAIYGKAKEQIKEQDGAMAPSSTGPSNLQAPPSTTMFVVVRMSPDGIGAPVGVYSDSSRAEAARDQVEPAQVYELMLNADPEEN
jgi:hypothetical protein